MELVNDRANQACGRAIGRAPQRVPDLGRQGAVLEQQRKQNGGISRERIQHRVLLGGVEEYLTNGAVREIANVHPVTVTGVLDVERDRTAPMWQASPGVHRVRLRCWHQASPARRTRSSSEILLRAQVRSRINDIACYFR
jgi:hypothetical protein